MADPSFSDEVLRTVSGTTTAWLPLTTPWVSIAACSSQLYGEFNTGPVIAFDPFYGSVIASNQIPCLPPEATVWWNPPTDGKTVYVLGPTFVCPAAYYAAQTLLVNSVTQEILCCPTSYTLGAIITHNPRTDFPAQCYSTCTNLESITYMTQSVESGSWYPFTRGIQSDPFTVYAVHVNGYIVAASTTSTSSSTSSLSSSSSSSGPSLVPALTTPAISAPSSTSPSSTPTPSSSSGLSSGAAAGIGIAVAAGIIIVAILAFFLYRRRRRRTTPQIQAYSGEPALRQEMDAHKQTLEHYGAGGPTHELATQNPQRTYELH